MPRLTTLLTFLLLGASSTTVHAQTSPPPPSNTPTPLATCLNGVSIPYSIFSSDTWQSDISPWQLRIRPTPSAVIRPTTYAQVAAALSCAVRTSTKVSCRNGGHSYGSYGVGGNDGALVIYMDAFQNMTFDAATGLLTYGGGSIVGDVVTWAWEKHGVHFPHVRANRVGLAGSSIGGGFGSTSRFLGTPMDNLVSVEYMLVNGTIVTASRTKNPDLFFVAQGAGSSYGILLSFTTKTWKPVYQQVTNFTISVGNVDIDTGVNALLAVQEFALSGLCPDELSLRWSLTAPPYTGSGFFYGDPAKFRSAIDPLMQSLPAETNLTTAVADFWSMENIATPSISSKIDTFPPRNFYLQALVLRTDQPFTYESAYALYNATTLSFNRTDMTKFGFIDLWGGVSRSLKDGDTCMAHAKSLFLIRWEGRLAAGLTTFPSDGIPYLRSQMRVFEDQLKRERVPLRGFVNYRDTELTLPEWSARLYAGNWERMRRIKRVYDPKGIFTTNAQSIPA